MSYEYAFTTDQSVPMGLCVIGGDKPSVEFWDLSCNQLIATYYVESLLGTDGHSARIGDSGGLMLYGAEPKWNVDKRNAQAIAHFLDDLEFCS